MEGLDCVVIGANDLSGAMGLPYQGSSPQVQAGVDEILAAAYPGFRESTTESIRKLLGTDLSGDGPAAASADPSAPAPGFAGTTAGRPSASSRHA